MKVAFININFGPAIFLFIGVCLLLWLFISHYRTKKLKSVILVIVSQRRGFFESATLLNEINTMMKGVRIYDKSFFESAIDELVNEGSLIRKVYADKGVYYVYNRNKTLTSND